MPLVSSVDYSTKRIYLSAETVNTDLDTLDVYREVRALRRIVEDHRKFSPIILAGGNLQKLPGVFTPAYVVLTPGTYIVPFDAPQRLKVVRDTFATDGRAGRDCFDRTTTISNIDIDVDFPEIEIREVSVGGSTLTPSEIWSHPSRTLTFLDLSTLEAVIENVITSNTASPADIAVAVRAAILTELSRLDVNVSSRTAPTDHQYADIRKVNNVPITGSGIEGSDEWRRA
jgi:hypothetical protein